MSNQSQFIDEDYSLILGDIERNSDLFSEEELRDLASSLAHVEELELIEKARTDFIAFAMVCGPAWMKFSSKGYHHKFGETFERMVLGDLKRLTISLAPRFGKSEFGSILLPAWCLGVHPDWKIIQASSRKALATTFGRKVKAIVDSEAYRKVFPGIKLSKDSKSSSAFATNRGGEYLAVGVEGGIAGSGADLFISDDIVDEQDVKSGNPEIYEKVWEWVHDGPLQRLQPGGRVVFIGTRWSKSDPIGRVKRMMAENPLADKYESIEVKALDDTGESNFPEIWSTAELTQKRNTMIPHKWAAQYEQNPTSKEGAIIRADSWRKWEKFKRTSPNSDEVEFEIPDYIYTLMVLDTAYTKNKRSNPTACTVWGVFEYKDESTGRKSNHLMLMHSYKKKMDFPELKRRAKEWIDDWEPDKILIEEKSSGPMLRSELKEVGVYTSPVMPKPKEDKVSRLNSVADVFASGMVHYIPTQDNLRCIDEVAAFPNGDEDDFTDTVAYSAREFRRGGFIKLESDEKPEESREPLSYKYY